MEFRIPILSQEAYSDTQRESTLENFEESRLESESAQPASDSDRLRWRAEATVLSPTVLSLEMTLRVCVHKRLKNVEAYGCTCLLTTITRPSLYRESLFMKPVRPNCARTSLRHIYPAHVQASATEHKRLDKAQHGDASQGPTRH